MASHNELNEAATDFIQYCMVYKPAIIDLEKEKNWSSFSLEELTAIQDKIVSNLCVTKKEMDQLRKGIFASLDVRRGQKFEDEESSKFLLNGLDGQQKWFNNRGMFTILFNCIQFSSIFSVANGSLL
jgi:hypothetical protein